MNKKRGIVISLFVILAICSVLIGADTQLIQKLFSGDQLAWVNLLNGRLPRTVVIILSAAALSIAGLVMQSLSRNKFISPQTAGTTDAAALGVLLSYIVLKSQSIYVKFGFAFVFAMISSVLFMLLLRKIKFKNIVYVPLIGLMYGALIEAVMTLLADQFNARQFLTDLNVGTFSKITFFNSTLLVVLIPALILIIIYAASFNIVSVGDDFARNLGLKPKTITAIGLLCIAVVSASVFIVVGPLPFLGLIIPNLVSLYYGDNLKKNLFDVAIFGSTFVLLNDIVSRLLIFPYEIPVGVTMGVSGAIIFLILIFRRDKKHE